MQVANANIEVDPLVKSQAQELFERLGMNLSTAVNIFLRQAIREQAIPFHINDGFYSASNMEYLKRITEEIDSGQAKLEKHEPLDR